jgi:hypothetical protein
MTVATLMEGAFYDPAFAFEHFQSHIIYFSHMLPIPRFSVMPYLLDPMLEVNWPAVSWHLNHQQAHDDFLATLPTARGSSRIGIPGSQLLVDVNLAIPEDEQWWLFSNLIEHQLADSVLPPISPVVIGT